MNHVHSVVASLSLGACSEVIEQMHRLAIDSGGRMIEQERLQDPSPKASAGRSANAWSR